jgi:hypothetical protein
MSRMPKWVSYTGVVLIGIGMLWAIWVMGSYVVEMIERWLHR